MRGTRYAVCRLERVAAPSSDWSLALEISRHKFESLGFWRRWIDWRNWITGTAIYIRAHTRWASCRTDRHWAKILNGTSIHGDPPINTIREIVVEQDLHIVAGLKSSFTFKVRRNRGRGYSRITGLLFKVVRCQLIWAFCIVLAKWTPSHISAWVKLAKNLTVERTTFSSVRKIELSRGAIKMDAMN